MSREVGEELNREVTPGPQPSMCISEPRHSAANHLRWTAAMEEDLSKIQKADPEETDIHKLFLTISKKVRNPHDVRTLGITLGCHPDDVDHHVTQERDIREAAYKFLCWTDENYGPVEKWEKIIEALTTLEKNTTIKELGLKQRLSAAKNQTLVHE